MRKKNKDLTFLMCVTPHDTEEYRLLEVEVEKRLKTSGQEKSVPDIELCANGDFQQEILVLINQIVEKQNDLDTAIKALANKLKVIN